MVKLYESLLCAVGSRAVDGRRRRSRRTVARATAVILTMASVLSVHLLGGSAWAQEGIINGGAPFTQDRVGAGDPATSAVAVSAARFADDSAAHVVLVRDDDPADALSGSPLTADGPMLLTASGALPDATRAELLRVLPDGGTVYVLGGPAAVTDAVTSEIRNAGLDPRRLAGTDRVLTSVAVADEFFTLVPADGVAALARAYAPADNPTAAWADAVTGGGWAAWRRVPILLTPQEGLHPEVARAIERHGITIGVLFGGETALSESVERSVQFPERTGGDDRAETAVTIVDYRWPAGTHHYVIVNGYRPDGWAFGLPAAGFSADHQAPILLADTTSLPPATAMQAGAPCADPDVDALVVGDDSVLGPQVQEQLAAAADGVCSGALADETADITAKTGLRTSCPEVPAVTRGNVYLCQLDFLSPTLTDPLAQLIVRDDAGNVTYDIGSGFLRTLPEFILEEGSDCATLVGRNFGYFDAVLYWFLAGEPPLLDGDGNGRPCDAEYPADRVEAFWTGGPPYNGQAE